MNQNNAKGNNSGKMLFATIFLSLSTVAVAQNTDDTLQTRPLQEVVVSASRMEEQVLDAARSISVINSEDIRNSVYTNVSELLSKQEGIYIVGTGQNPGSLQTMYQRGANAEHTVILLDGVRITDPSSPDNALNLAELSLTNIERIEIVRGSHSTLYGTSAIGGVINIITKKASKPGLHGSAAVAAGTFGSGTSDLAPQLHLNYSTKAGIYFSAEALYNTVKGMDATVDTVTTAGYKNRDKDDFSKMDLTGKIGYKKDKWDAYLSWKSTDQQLDVDKGAYTDDDNYTVDFKRNVYAWQVAAQATEKWNIRFNGGYTDMLRQAIDDSSQVDAAGTTDHSYFSSTYEGSVLNNELQASYGGKRFKAVFGANHYRETMTTKSFYTNTAWAYTSESDLDTLNLGASQMGGFMHLDLNGALLAPRLQKLHLALGARFGSHDLFGGFSTYEINPSYRISDQGLLYASWSTGYNAPALYRLYAPDVNYQSNIKRGNTALNPEQSQTFELGFKQQVNKNTSLSFSLFRTNVDQLIEYVYLWDKAIGLDTLGNDWMRDDYRGDTYLNLGTQVNHGFEFGFVTALSEKVRLKGNVSMVNGRLETKPTDTDYTSTYHVQLYNSGAFLQNEIEQNGLARRSNTANLILMYEPAKNWQFSADVRYAGTRTDVYYNAALGPYGALGQKLVADYALFGFNMRYVPIKNMTLNLNVSNLFDTEYQEIYGYQTRGRGIYLKIHYQF